VNTSVLAMGRYSKRSYRFYFKLMESVGDFVIVIMRQLLFDVGEMVII
jgi:hypothetical protein